MQHTQFEAILGFMNPVSKHQTNHTIEVFEQEKKSSQVLCDLRGDQPCPRLGPSTVPKSSGSRSLVSVSQGCTHLTSPSKDAESLTKYGYPLLFGCHYFTGANNWPMLGMRVVLSPECPWNREQDQALQ